MTTRGRYAPSPTGEIHLGNARSALVAWWGARSEEGDFLWRVEDIDQQRAVSGLAERQMRDLAWLGLDWEEGPDRGGPFGPYVQSERDGLYRDALRLLETRGQLFPCRRTRKELASIASAPHGPAQSPYPTRLRPTALESGWLEEALADEGSQPSSAAVRFRVAPGRVAWTDAIYGAQEEDVHRAVGDFVLRRRDGVWAYQLAVVVDDAAMQVDQVVRGADLLDSTARQIVLQRALGVATPRYAHVPLLLTEGGEKLSKRDGSTTLASLRHAGVRPEAIVGLLAHSLGLTSNPAPRCAKDVTPYFAWHRLDSRAIVVAPDLARRLREADRLEGLLRPLERRASEEK
ncbi:MAG: tRNA glutamyl-Q(34) synthetase GluQRS [Acidobacteriota bacterium]